MKHMSKVSKRATTVARRRRIPGPKMVVEAVQSLNPRESFLMGWYMVGVANRLKDGWMIDLNEEIGSKKLYILNRRPDPDRLLPRAPMPTDTRAERVRALEVQLRSLLMILKGEPHRMMFSKFLTDQVADATRVLGDDAELPPRLKRSRA